MTLAALFTSLIESVEENLRVALVMRNAKYTRNKWQRRRPLEYKLDQMN